MSSGSQLNTPGGSTDAAFLQRRMALFSLSYAALVFATWLVACVIYIAAGEANELWDVGTWYVFATTATLLALGLFCRGPQRSRYLLIAVETGGLLTASVFVILMMLGFGLVIRPELMLILALANMLALRSALVPSGVRHTLVLTVAIGIAVVVATYLRYSRDVHFQAITTNSERTAGRTTAWAAQWWFLTTMVCAVISRVVYGLRREVRAAQRLGQYTLDSRLGSGGMGEVWRATHHFLQRPAAIKLIKKENLGGQGKDDSLVVSRFEREAQATAALQSPHTVELYDFGISEDGVFYHVIELLSGSDLTVLVNQFGPMPAERVVHILKQVCDSLDDAHSAGVVHRDIKPGNIFLTRRGRHLDYAKVLDFGLVKQVGEGGDELQLTGEGRIPGTPAFLAPEMATGKAVDGRTDIYALAGVAYWLLTGGFVFDAETAVEMVAAHLSVEPIPPSQKTELPVPEWLDELIIECLAKRPDGRPSSALELLDRLEQGALERDWTPERARKWWELHKPQTLPATDQSDSGRPRIFKPL